MHAKTHRPGWGERRGDHRMRRQGFGPWGPESGWGPGGFGRGHGGPGRGRGRARRGDVRASILALLAERPMHGYEMIREIADRTQEAWKPSPGSVYPTLQLLEDEGVIVGEESGGKKLFSLTDTGREEAAAQPEGSAPWDAVNRGFDHEAHRDARRAAMQVTDALRQVVATGSDDQRAKALEVMAEARRKLYLILAEAE
ncbi:MAG TPA: PadR family transcriptional regulator [Yinghuangia sp.]|uniref:PadR family transcriptional regulator n=1 Tax=Yinghuangia sp. YIM S10712 TaxID=3436930 RepID=UPI002C1C2710|nr:PadR family transcriptional regulator [Yinghuangia sp.]